LPATTALFGIRLGVDERFERVAHLRDDTWRVAVCRKVDDHAVDACVEHPTFDLLGYLIGRADDRPGGVRLPEVPWCVIAVDDHHRQQAAGFQSCRVAVDFVATLPEYVEFAGQLGYICDDVEWSA
jgi:hypothetical protein